MNHQAVYPQAQLTVLAPSSLDTLTPLEVTDSSSGVHAAIVERYAIDGLPVHWRTSCGFYILFSPIALDNKFDAYVGKASSGFHRRLASHHETKDYWRSAILITKEGHNGFTSAQSAWLERRMREILDLSPNVNVRNLAQTGELTLPEWEKGDMEKVILSTLRIMFLRGYRNASMGVFAKNLTNRISNRPLPPLPPVAPSVPAPAVSIPLVVEEDKFLALKAWRDEESLKSSISPFIIFHDKTLREIARHAPSTVEELLAIPGIGQYKASLYGPGIAAIFASKPAPAPLPVPEPATPVAVQDEVAVPVAVPVVEEPSVAEEVPATESDPMEEVLPIEEVPETESEEASVAPGYETVMEEETPVQAESPVDEVFHEDTLVSRDEDEDSLLSEFFGSEEQVDAPVVRQSVSGSETITSVLDIVPMPVKPESDVLKDLEMTSALEILIGVSLEPAKEREEKVSTAPQHMSDSFLDGLDIDPESYTTMMPYIEPYSGDAFDPDFNFPPNYRV